MVGLRTFGTADSRVLSSSKEGEIIDPDGAGTSAGEGTKVRSFAKEGGEGKRNTPQSFCQPAKTGFQAMKTLRGGFEVAHRALHLGGNS